MIRRLLVAAFSLVAAIVAPLAAQEPAWKLAGTVDAGFVSASGNTNLTTISFGDKFSAKRGYWTFSQLLAYVYGKTDSVESANQLRIGARAEFALNKRLSGFAAATYERNAHAGFDRRVEELAGVTWVAFADTNDTFTLDAGGVLTQQDNVDGTSDSSPSARGAAAYKHVFKENTFFSQTFEYVANLTESGAYRANSETALVAPLARRLSMKLGYRFQYDSRPPATFGTSDRVFTSGLQVSF